MAPGRPEDDDSDEDDNQNSDDSEYGGFRVGSRSARSSTAGDDSEGAMGKLKWLEQWEPWRNFVIIVILLNTIVLAMEADNPRMTWSPVVDSIFLGIFCFELVLRLVVYRCDFFVNEDRGWNWFDFIVVGLGVMDQCVSGLFWDNDEGDSQVSNIIAALRVIRLLRVLRAVRIFKQLKPLRLLANGLINSLSSVFWIALMFLSLVFTSAILVTTVIGNSDQSFGSVGDDEQIQRWFGTMGKSMETLSIFLTCDDWSTPARMVNKVYPYMEFFWIWYIVMGAFWVLSLLTGLMADKMKEARDEDEDEQKTEPHEFEELLESLRSKQEQEGPLSIDCKQFQDIVSQEKVSKALGDAGLKDMDDNHLSWLFKAFDRDNNGTISWDELKESLTQISRHASPLASPLEIMKIEGVLVRLDRTLRNWRSKHPSSADKHHRNDMGWDQRLELVHARSALLKERLKALDGDLQVFFKAMNYDPKADCAF